MPERSDAFDLERFVAAQQGVFDKVLAELHQGRKESHWMWFVFPQLSGLGKSQMAQRYAISSLAQAQAYLAHPLLGARLRECARLLLESRASSAEEILGSVDAMKLRSSITLFSAADPDEEIVAAVLGRFFDGAPDESTLALLSVRSE